MYTLDCIRNKPSALSHSDVHLMTHDVQLPAMMCNYTFYTYKINALLPRERRWFVLCFYVYWLCFYVYY